MTRPNDLIEPSQLELRNGLRQDDVIHRYCSIKELYVMLRGSLSLACPFIWEDKFENPLFRAKFTNRNGKQIDLRKAGQKLYCQCWTIEKESDAMWKLFGSQSTGVRVTTSVKNLQLQAYNSHDSYRNEAVFTKIGKIEYLSESGIKQKFRSNEEFIKRFMEPNCEGFYDSLLIKRTAYSYEKEVRLIVHDFDDRFGGSETNRLSIPIAGTHWIQHVTFGPSVDTDTFEAHRGRLQQIGLENEKISRSDLYGPLEYSISVSR